MPAFQAAIDAGADYFELDVRTTSDGKFVIMHDNTLDRTTNGTGEVHKHTFDEIRALDAGASGYLLKISSGEELIAAKHRTRELLAALAANFRAPQ